MKACLAVRVDAVVPCPDFPFRVKVLNSLAARVWAAGPQPSPSSGTACSWRKGTCVLSVSAECKWLNLYQVQAGPEVPRKLREHMSPLLLFLCQLTPVPVPAAEPPLQMLWGRKQVKCGHREAGFVFGSKLETDCYELQPRVSVSGL